MSSGVINIIFSQAVAMVGIPGGSINVIETIQNIIDGADHFKIWDTVLGLSCIAILIFIWVRS
jgi:MFS superfamily sulfate permease-like transporter